MLTTEAGPVIRPRKDFLAEGLGWPCWQASQVMKLCWEPNEHTSLSAGPLQSPGKGAGVSARCLRVLAAACDPTIPGAWEKGTSLFCHDARQQSEAPGECPKGQENRCQPRCGSPSSVSSAK